MEITISAKSRNSQADRFLENRHFGNVISQNFTVLLILTSKSILKSLIPIYLVVFEKIKTASRDEHTLNSKCDFQIKTKVEALNKTLSPVTKMRIFKSLKI